MAKGSLQERSTRFLYTTGFGRLLLRALVRPGLSKAAGAFLSMPLSKPLIGPFVRNHGINLEQFLDAPYRSYNDFFCRRIRPELRPICPDDDALVSPADSLLTVMPITASGTFLLKGTAYTAASLLQDEALAARYLGGYAFLFRLTVDDYHRYCFPASGQTAAPVRIPGVLHTVAPLANELFPIYHENTREYTLLETERFGTLLCMEVGAMLVGRIVNHPLTGSVAKGQEKGYFQFGGSTVVVLAEPGRVTVSPELLQTGAAGTETPVLYGQAVARSAR